MFISTQMKNSNTEIKKATTSEAVQKLIKLINAKISEVDMSEENIDSLLKLSANYIKIMPLLMNFSKELTTQKKKEEDTIGEKIRNDHKAYALSMKLLERISKLD